jgi:hypothetical protein
MTPPCECAATWTQTTDNDKRGSGSATTRCYHFNIVYIDDDCCLAFKLINIWWDSLYAILKCRIPSRSSSSSIYIL